MMKRSWSTVWAKQSDGTWKAIHDNWNYDSK
jgi:ketosteroid isomerase-like protein